MKKLEEIKNLLRAAKIKDLRDNYMKTLASRSNIDKYDFKFGGDERFSVFKVPVRLSCYTGYYGNSSCSTFMIIDSELAKEALNHYLNHNVDAVLEGMADYMEEKASSLVAQAEKELAEQQEILDQIKRPNQETQP